MPTITFRVAPEEKERYKEATDAEGVSMSEDLRSHVKQKGDGDDGDTRPLPDDEQLRRAFVILDSVCDPDTRLIDVEIAKTEISNKTNTPKGRVRTRHFKPLERRNYIKPAGGRIEVRDLD